MKNTYQDLIEQSYRFPQGGFDIKDGYLRFNGVSLKYLIEKYRTPFKLTYLPKIGHQIKKARLLFKKSIEKYNYQGDYYYCYCTKCNHFSHVISEAMKHQVHLETSSSFDIDLILHLFKAGKIDKDRIILHNGYKTDEYLQKIIDLRQQGFKNALVILDSQYELERLRKLPFDGTLQLGLRMAINEEVQSAYYTSRLGIRPSKVVDFYQQKIANDPRFELKMLHFYVDSGIKDTLYYWGEFQKALQLYHQLKMRCASLTAINLGGGLPIQNHLGFEYDYEYMIDQIVKNIKESCAKEGINEPDIFTEFGKFTVGESSAIIFSVLEAKYQNDTESWYIINNSLMNTIPDAWSMHEKFILLPINKWDQPYQRTNIGGISCDHSDYYNSEDFNQEVMLPRHQNNDKEALYLGFFHTGAYQDAISGYGGIKHCLIPSPKQVIVEQDEQGQLTDYIYRDEQTVEDMFHILGYR